MFTELLFSYKRSELTTIHLNTILLKILSKTFNRPSFLKTVAHKNDSKEAQKCLNNNCVTFSGLNQTEPAKKKSLASFIVVTILTFLVDEAKSEERLRHSDI